MQSSTLKKKLKSKTNLPEPLTIRLHRAISWLKCAEENQKDLDQCFLAQWIAFNACYAMDLHTENQKTEREKFRHFITTLVLHDEEKRVFNLLWEKFSGPIRLLIENQYVYKTFWDYHRGEANEWEMTFRKSIADANHALAAQHVPALLEIVLDRLYVLRNQLMHGGATYKSSKNRSQLTDGSNIIGWLIPIIIDIMMNNPEEDWGEILYPVIEG